MTPPAHRNCDHVHVHVVVVVVVVVCVQAIVVVVVIIVVPVVVVIAVVGNYIGSNASGRQHKVQECEGAAKLSTFPSPQSAGWEVETIFTLRKNFTQMNTSKYSIAFQVSLKIQTDSCFFKES